MRDIHSLAGPSAWVLRHGAKIRAGGRVLDLACGSGRHSIFLAAQGFQVLGVDKNPDALASVKDRRGIRTRQVDLEGEIWPLAGECFDGVVVTNYLYRPFLPQLLACLAPGACLIYETFMEGNEAYGKPSNPDFLLRSQELLELARQFGLQVLAYEEGYVEQPHSSVVQRLCARRGALI